MSYTKWKWEVIQPGVYCNCQICACGTTFIIDTDTKRAVCKMEWSGLPQAKLIAAAPQLLEACKMARHNEGKRWGEIRDVLDAAIEAAESQP